MNTPNPTPPPSRGSFWKDHGTKVLGLVIELFALLATGSVVFPPPLNKYSTAITSWAVFLNIIFGGLVVARGFTNTTAIAAQVTANQVAVAKGDPPPLPAAQPAVVADAVVAQIKADATPASPLPQAITTLSPELIHLIASTSAAATVAEFARQQALYRANHPIQSALAAAPLVKPPETP